MVKLNLIDFANITYDNNKLEPDIDLLRGISNLLLRLETIYNNKEEFEILLTNNPNL